MACLHGLLILFIEIKDSKRTDFHIETEIVLQILTRTKGSFIGQTILLAAFLPLIEPEAGAFPGDSLAERAK